MLKKTHEYGRFACKALWKFVCIVRSVRFIAKYYPGMLSRFCGRIFRIDIGQSLGEGFVQNPCTRADDIVCRGQFFIFLSFGKNCASVRVPAG